MSRVYRLASVFFWVACTRPSPIQEPVTGPECADDVCVLNVIATRLISAPCVGYSVLLAYSELTGVTLIQCSKFGSEPENRVYVFDRNNNGRESFEYVGGRFIRPHELAKADSAGIADRSGTMALCSARDRKQQIGGVLLIVERTPNTSGTEPYCYRINYAVAGKAGLAVSSDEGRDLSPLSDAAASEWAGLRTSLSRYVEAGRGKRPAGANSDSGEQRKGGARQ